MSKLEKGLLALSGVSSIAGIGFSIYEIYYNKPLSYFPLYMFAVSTVSLIIYGTFSYKNKLNDKNYKINK